MDNEDFERAIFSEVQAVIRLCFKVLNDCSLLNEIPVNSVVSVLRICFAMYLDLSKVITNPLSDSTVDDLSLSFIELAQHIESARNQNAKDNEIGVGADFGDCENDLS